MSLPPLSRRESSLLALAALLVGAAVLGPSLPAPARGGAPSADDQPWRALPHAMDVLSHLPFAVLGIWGLRSLRWLDRAHEQLQDAAPLPQAVVQPPINALDCAWMFFAGLVLTALGFVVDQQQAGPAPGPGPEQGL